MWLRVQVAVGPDPAGALAIGLCHEIGHAARDLRMAERVGMQGLLDGVGSPPVRAVRVVRNAPHPLLRGGDPLPDERELPGLQAVPRAGAAEDRGSPRNTRELTDIHDDAAGAGCARCVRGYTSRAASRRRA